MDKTTKISPKLLRCGNTGNTQDPSCIFFLNCHKKQVSRRCKWELSLQFNPIFLYYRSVDVYVNLNGTISPLPNRIHTKHLSTSNGKPVISPADLHRESHLNILSF